MDTRQAAILRLLAGNNDNNNKKDSGDEDGFNQARPFNIASTTNSLSLLTSKIGAFLEQAKDAPAEPMDIEIDEELFEEEDTDDEETDNSDDDDDIQFDPETMKFYSAKQSNHDNHLKQCSSRRLSNADDDGASGCQTELTRKLVEVVDKTKKREKKNNNNDNDDGDGSTSSSDIDIVTFSSDDDNEGDDGIDLAKLSEEKKKKLTALFSGKLLPPASSTSDSRSNRNCKKSQTEIQKLDAPIAKKANRKDLLKFEEQEDQNGTNKNDEDDESAEPFDPSNPLRGKYIQMNVIAGILEEDKKKQRNGDIVLPTQKELVFEKKKRRKNQKKMAQLVKALVSQQ